MSKNASMCTAISVDISLIASLNDGFIMNIKVNVSLNGISSLSMNKYTSISMRMS